jgi:ArsR family transcriptional regulator
MKSKYPNSYKILKAVSDSSRLTIIEILMKKPTHVKPIMEKLNIEPTLLSHHLRVLKKEGIVVSKIEGKWRLYSLAPGVKLKGSVPGLSFKNMRIVFK